MGHKARELDKMCGMYKAGSLFDFHIRSHYVDYVNHLMPGSRLYEYSFFVSSMHCISSLVLRGDMYGNGSIV